MSTNFWNEENNIKEMFDEINKSKSGKITFLELKNIFIKLESEISDSEVKEMIKISDTSNSGTINFIDFNTIILSL
jgi:Ca2+-binding EF-hand superfamily protein